MTSGEQRVLLKTMFVALYFDGNAELKQVLANSPFDKLLPGNPKDIRERQHLVGRYIDAIAQ